MSRIRTAFAIGLTAFLVLGYLGSQFAALFGDVQAYSRAVDVPSVKLLSLLALVGVVGLAFVPRRDEETSE